MRSVGFLIAAAAMAGFMTMAPAARAQISENGGPVSYSADNLQYFDTDHRLVLTGNVDIVQNDARLRANQITLYFSQSTAPTPAAGQGQQSGGGLGSGDIERMLAEGDVYYVRPQQSARGDRADYEVSSDSVTFSGNVVVASDENVIRGETLVLQIGTRQTTIRPQNGQRVRGVFIPRHGAPTPASTPAPASH